MSKTGFPIALQDCLVTISFLAINAIVNSLGVLPSAGVGVAEKVCAFVMLQGLMGHSLGGATAVSVGRREDVTAVVDLDGTMLGEEGNIKKGNNNERNHD